MFQAMNDNYMPDLQTPRLLLRKLTMGDAADIYAYSKDPQVARYVLWSPHASISESRAYLRYTLRQYRNGEPAPYGITLRQTGRVIGTIGFAFVNYEHSAAEIGYSLARDEWNHGYMSEALSAMIRYGFEHYRLYRIEAMHDVRNAASGRVMEKCGMRYEGTLRGKLYSKAEHIDVCLYSIIRPEFYPDAP